MPNNNPIVSGDLIKDIMDDPAASDWLKNAITQLLARDCVDAANDSTVLQAIMVQRAQETTSRGTMMLREFNLHLEGTR